MSYGKFYSPAKVESDQKDIIIAQLKADIFELHKNEEDFYILNEELRKMDIKIKLLLEERILQDSEHRARHEQAVKQINLLRNEVDQLSSSIKVRLNETNTLKEENLSLSEICDLRQIDLQNAKRDFNKAKDEVLIENEHIDRLAEQQLQFEEDLRNTTLRNSDLKRGIEDLTRKLKEKERILLRLEEQLANLNKNIDEIGLDNSDVQNQINKINQELKQLESSNVDLGKQIRNGEARVQKLRQEAEMAQQDALRSGKNYQLENVRNNELANRLNQLEQLNFQRDDQLNDYENQLNQLTGENDNIINTNNQMKDDWDGLKRHLEVLLQENSTLINELEVYCDDDDKVKAILNRRNRVRELAKKVETSQRFTYKQSPIKSNQAKQSFTGSGQKKQRSAF